MAMPSPMPAASSGWSWSSRATLTWRRRWPATLAPGVTLDAAQIHAALANAEETAIREIADTYPMPFGNDHVQVGG